MISCGVLQNPVKYLFLIKAILIITVSLENMGPFGLRLCADQTTVFCFVPRSWEIVVLKIKYTKVP